MMPQTWCLCIGNHLGNSAKLLHLQASHLSMLNPVTAGPIIKHHIYGHDP